MKRLDHLSQDAVAAVAARVALTALRRDTGAGRQGATSRVKPRQLPPLSHPHKVPCLYLAITTLHLSANRKKEGKKGKGKQVAKLLFFFSS